MKYVMGRKALLILCLSVSVVKSYGQNDSIGVPANKISTLVFKEDVVDTEVGSPDYFVKVKGRCLLIQAKNNRVQPTSLFVRYGKNKEYYIAELFPNDQAPLKYHIGQEVSVKQVTVKEPSVFSVNKNKQAYYTIGVKKNGIKIILTDIIHTDNTTHLQLFIDNNSSINFCLSYWMFEYVTVYERLLFYGRKKNRKLVVPTAAPDNVHVPAKCGKYVECAIPTHVSTGGLAVFLGDSDREREFRLLIPKKVLLKAKRR
ncbi:MAG: hypothetical protein ACX93T_03185 [Bacteroidota bacterium]